MYAVYKQTHPTTGVEHSIYCNFFNMKEKNLVIASVNQIHVYRLNPDNEDAKKPDEVKDQESTGPVIGSGVKQKLECLATFALFGNIMSMKSVILVGAQRDALLLSFSDAKLALVEYDPGMHDLNTVSLHYFEDQKLKDFASPCHIPTIQVDPDGRCAAMLIYGTKMVILPFQKDIFAEDVESIVGGGGAGGASGSRSPILNSYIIDLLSFDEKILNVLDFQFLHGYYEPTIFILYEPYPTWAGRVAVRSDTCSIVAISLNIQEKVHPIIWSLANLPFDCKQCLSVPKPIGGILIFAVNYLLYLNQSVPPYGVSLNSIGDVSTSFPIRVQEGIRISLDAVRAAFITYDKLVLSLKGGELYVLTLMVDGMRSVRSFHFDKAAASVLTTCMCVCEDGFLFLGSRLGNSLLLKYSEKESGDVKVEPPTKKKKLDISAADMASDVSQIENLDELEVYGVNENPSGTTITAFTFEVCDNIWNIAPCGNIVMGEPAFLSEEFSNTADPELELVTTSGFSKNGALSVLQRSVRPQVVTTFDLPGCVDMWTVQGPISEENDANRSLTKKSVGSTADDSTAEPKTLEEGGEAPVDIENGHAFLILSRADSSMILQTGQEIMELDHSGFSTQTPTIFAGNIGDGKFIVQVSPRGVRLLEGVQQLQHIPIDIGSPIVHCSVADPYILLLGDEGHVMMMTLRPEGLGATSRLVVSKPQVTSKPKIFTICAYRDVSGVFTVEEEQQENTGATTESRNAMKTSLDKVFSIDQSTIDDEDELLYGESDASVFDSSMNASTTEESKARNVKKKEVKPSYWCIICRENGCLEIWSMPDFKMVFYVKNFTHGQKVLVDSMQSTEAGSSWASMASTSSEKVDKSFNIGDVPLLKEMIVVGLGCQKSRPLLMARVEDELFVYEAFPFHQSKVKNTHLKIRFKKIHHNLILREKRQSRVKRKEDEVEIVDPGEKHRKLLRYFDDISGYSGVFLCGTYPHWLFMTSRGSLRIHPMSIDGAVTCFASFHNINCPKGFLYFNKQGELRISVLPTHLTYDAPWPIRKVPLRCTPHSVQYHADSKTYSVITSVPEPCNKMPRTDTEDREFDTVEKDERFIYPSIHKYTCQLYSPTSWEVVPNTSVDFDEFEVVTGQSYVYLKSEENVTGFKGYIAIGTNFSYGEEVTSRGRIVIFDVIEVVPEPGQPLTKHKIKVLYRKEQKGPVTALSHVNGYLISAIGQKLFMWQLKDNDLIGVAFIDTHIYIHSLVTLKSLILAADIIKSITLYRYQSDLKVLSLVSRDVKPLEVYTCDFIVDNSQLNFIVTDRLKNILVYSYQPEMRESHGGQKLLRKADFNVGSHINTMFRIRTKLSDPIIDKKSLPLLEKRQLTYFATLDGSLGYVLPVSEKVYRRLLMLQNALIVHIPSVAGLNPKSYRALRTSGPELVNSHRSILDGELLWKYIYFSFMEKAELAKRIGTSVDQVGTGMINNYS
ncbi:hypothetical protein ACJMK2_009649 [Sinanodonta woodiana]|uniref:Cleavage and polyadenylation specificity factor subunit 1 n=1 Tax=Sinanodonta woodiana TaxID=1069815 RepID=A0ABD3VEH1_SINWO